ncbi:hypothetical protein MesoLj131c_46990 [Mesorhizobium sp. 131-3-5]|uniref:hypothetical protein n=1 Tax=Mesorhizobium sp. 131-3-5 TaxID=2744520 RepID=UPI0019295BA0|nr:hypothetical protein [Mesorhizobium sp. 131-3-5]BCH10441.1 hypothetical protein MesoLj131c_46990 [Mesorhizobium sp. 131-3-5]
MTYAAIALLLIAAALRTRLARGSLAYLILKTSNVLYDAGARAMANMEEDRRHG